MSFWRLRESMDWRLNSQRPRFAQTIDRAMEAIQLDDEEHAASRRRSVSWSEAKYPGCNAPLGDSEADWCANESSRHNTLHRRFTHSTTHQLTVHCYCMTMRCVHNDTARSMILSPTDRCTRAQLARGQSWIAHIPWRNSQLRGIP